jgi:4-amino-4-deoxy-L-arabinose transferase-like glycosyltransferase
VPFPRLVILGILVLGASLRLLEIGDGIPYTVGVDEPEIIDRVVRMMKTADFNPHFYDYPGFTFYFHTAVASARFLTGAMAGRWSSLDQVWSGDFYLWSRIATVCLSVLTIYVVYRTALRWGQPAAIIAALAMAVHPQLVQNTHFVLTDTPLTFFVALTLLTSLTAAAEQRPSWFFMSGLCAGLAAATKYPGALTILMPLLATMTGMPVRARVAALGAVIGGATLGFLTAAPFSILDLPGFLNGFASLMQHYNREISAADSAVTYAKYVRGWFGWPGVLPAAAGWPAMAICAIGLGRIAWGLRLRESRAAAAVFLLFPIAYFWFIANQSLRYGRYAMPLAPALSIALAMGILAVLAWIDRRAPFGRPRLVKAALLLALFVPPLAQAYSASAGLRLESTQEQAAKWLAAHVQPHEPIVIEGVVARLPPNRFRAGETGALIRKSIDQYRKDGTVYLIATSSVYDKVFQAADPTRVASEIAAYNAIFRETQTVQIFAPSAEHPGPTIRIQKIVKE